MQLRDSLEENKSILKELLPIGKSFDLITRDLTLGDTQSYFLGVNGMCKTDVLQQIIADLQNPMFTLDRTIENLAEYINAKLGYAQVTLVDSFHLILSNVLSGPVALLVEGFSKAVIIDIRTYPTRSISEPENERITKGARDGFVETMLFNANLIRRRIRSPRLTFELHHVGSQSKSDVSLVYLDDLADPDLCNAIGHKLDHLNISSLTMGTKSLEELLVRKSWWHPLPSILSTERPDLACSYLSEGHILLLVDNSPLVLVLPCTIFQFTQSVEDYYKTPLAGSYFRMVRILCVPVNLFLLPLFLLIGVYYPQLSQRLQLLSTPSPGKGHLIFYVFAVEFLLELFRYSGSLSSGRFSGSLSIVGGLIIGDMAVSLNWASPEVLFYAAVTMLTSLSLSSLELADAIRIYRLFLLICTALAGTGGLILGTLLVLVSVITTPTFGHMSYFWPLVPFEPKALKNLLIRTPTYQAQPSRTWNRKGPH